VRSPLWQVQGKINVDMPISSTVWYRLTEVLSIANVTHLSSRTVCGTNYNGHDRVSHELKVITGRNGISSITMRGSTGIATIRFFSARPTVVDSSLVPTSRQ
jgi:hypothetical protein